MKWKTSDSATVVNQPFATEEVTKGTIVFAAHPGGNQLRKKDRRRLKKAAKIASHAGQVGSMPSVAAAMHMKKPAEFASRLPLPHRDARIVGMSVNAHPVHGHHVTASFDVPLSQYETAHERITIRKPVEYETYTIDQPLVDPKAKIEKAKVIKLPAPKIEAVPVLVEQQVPVRVQQPVMVERPITVEQPVIIEQPVETVTVTEMPVTSYTTEIKSDTIDEKRDVIASPAKPQKNNFSGQPRSPFRVGAGNPTDEDKTKTPEFETSGETNPSGAAKAAPAAAAAPRSTFADDSKTSQQTQSDPRSPFAKLSKGGDVRFQSKPKHWFLKSPSPAWTECSSQRSEPSTPYLPDSSPNVIEVYAQINKDKRERDRSAAKANAQIAGPSRLSARSDYLCPVSKSSPVKNERGSLIASPAKATNRFFQFQSPQSRKYEVSTPGSVSSASSLSAERFELFHDEQELRPAAKATPAVAAASKLASGHDFKTSRPANFSSIHPSDASASATPSSVSSISIASSASGRYGNTKNQRSTAAKPYPNHFLHIESPRQHAYSPSTPSSVCSLSSDGSYTNIRAADFVELTPKMPDWSSFRPSNTPSECNAENTKDESVKTPTGFRAASPITPSPMSKTPTGSPAASPSVISSLATSPMIYQPASPAKPTLQVHAATPVATLSQPGTPRSPPQSSPTTVPSEPDDSDDFARSKEEVNRYNISDRPDVETAKTSAGSDPTQEDVMKGYESSLRNIVAQKRALNYAKEKAALAEKTAQINKTRLSALEKYVEKVEKNSARMNPWLTCCGCQTVDDQA